MREPVFSACVLDSVDGHDDHPTISIGGNSIEPIGVGCQLYDFGITCHSIDVEVNIVANERHRVYRGPSCIHIGGSDDR